MVHLGPGLTPGLYLGPVMPWIEVAENSRLADHGDNRHLEMAVGEAEGALVSLAEVVVASGVVEDHVDLVVAEEQALALLAHLDLPLSHQIDYLDRGRWMVAELG